MMDLETIQRRVEEIRAVQWDAESAHGLEDLLYLQLLEALAEQGPPDWAEKAKAALATQQIPFERWCA